MKLQRQLLALLAFFLTLGANAQTEVVKGEKVPRLSPEERNTISASGSPYAKGQLIYNTDTNCLEYWNGDDWVPMCGEVTPYIEPILPPKDETGQYRLDGKTCYDVAVTNYPVGNTCMPLDSRVNDFAGGFSFNYTFSGSAAYDITDYYAIGDGKDLVNLSRAGDIISATFVGNVRDLATNTTKPLTLIVAFDDNNNDSKYLSIDISVQDCSCGCTLRKNATEWLTFMCYNLGARSDMSIADQVAYTSLRYNSVAASSTYATDAANVHGDLYQWGRKGDGHQVRSSQSYLNNNTTPESSVIIGVADLDPVSGQVTLADAIGKFIKNNASGTNYDWRAPQLHTLWDGNGGSGTTRIKTANDPCPQGWRVPTQAEWAAVADEALNDQTATDLATWGISGSAPTTPGWLFKPRTGAATDVTTANATLFLPAAGCRSLTNSGFSNVGAGGFYWSSSRKSVEAYIFNFSSSGVNATYSNYRALGCSVRCVAQ